MVRREIPNVGVIEYNQQGKTSIFRFNKGSDRFEFLPQGVVLFDGPDKYGPKPHRIYDIGEYTIVGRADGSIRIVGPGGLIMEIPNAHSH